MCYKYLTDTPPALREETQPKQEVIKPAKPIEQQKQSLEEKLLRQNVCLPKPLHGYSHIFLKQI